MNHNEETIAVIKNTLEKMQEAYYAVNEFAVVTRVCLSGYDLEYYKAKELLTGWLNLLEKEK